MSKSTDFDPAMHVPETNQASDTVKPAGRADSVDDTVKPAGRADSADDTVKPAGRLDPPE